MMDTRPGAALDFPLLLRVLASFAETEAGGEEVSSWAPFDGGRELRSALVAEAVSLLGGGFRASLAGAKSPAPALRALGVKGSALDARTLLDLALWLRAGARFTKAAAKEKKRAPRLSDLAANFDPLENEAREAEDALAEDAQTGTARVKADASPELRRLHRARAAARAELDKCLSDVVAGARDALSESSPTLRDGRFVLAVRSDRKASVRGILHDRSGSGATLFIEPEAAVEANNRLAGAEADIRREEARILRALTEAFRRKLDELERGAALLAHLDSLFAAARFSSALDCTPARVGNFPLRLAGARHPFLDARLREKLVASRATRDRAEGEGRDVVPVSLEMEGGVSRCPDAGHRGSSAASPSGRALVVTGPNTGGKTALLKTTGLLALMAHAGIPVPAEEASFPLLRGVHADIGDPQNLLENLSTFSGHARNAARILREMETPALVLLDELGSGTDPDEGAALAMALLEEFLARGAFVVATTHHGELKAFAHAREGVENASMEFDERTLRPTYRVLLGVPGRSRAFDVALAVGVPEGVVGRARSHRGAETARMEDVLAHLESERQLARETRERLEGEERRTREAGEKARLMREKLKMEREQTRGEFKKELRRALESFRGTLRGMTEGVASEKEKEAAFRAAREEARQLLASLAPEEISAEEETSVVPLREGMRVAVEGFPHAEGTLLHLLGSGEAEVEVGGKRLKIPAARLRSAGKQPPAVSRQPSAQERLSPPRAGGWGLEADGSRSAAREINLIGKTGEEALPMLEKFLDDAARAGYGEIRVVHGRGTGRLRAALRKALKEHPAVESFGDADAREGGSGATAVKMKT